MQKKRLSKKRFFTIFPTLDSQISTDIPSHSDDFSKKSSYSDNNSEETTDHKENNINVSVQPALNSFSMIDSHLAQSNLYTTEEHDDLTQMHKKYDKHNFFNEIVQNSGVYTQEESDGETPTPEINKSLKKKYKKNQKIHKTEKTEEDFLEIILPVKRKVINNSFFDKIKSNKIEKTNIILAKGILTDNSLHESLEITAPLQLEGFTLKKQTSNPRDLLRESLKTEINLRKTTHITPDSIFSKSITELPGKKSKKAEEEDSDYIPEENEVFEALELEKIIKLEEDSKSSSYSSEVSETASQKDAEMDLAMNPTDLTEDKIDLDSNFQLENLCSESVSSKETVSVPLSGLATPKVFSKSSKTNKFIENEAEIGSDHEEHDDLIKPCRDSHSEKEEDDCELEDLIDRTQIDDNEENRFNKHLSDLIQQDKIQINQVINAEFKRNRKNLDFFNESSNILSKKQKLLEEKKDLLAERESRGFFKGFDMKNQRQEMDEEEFDKFKVLKGSQELKFIRNQFSPKIVLDEQSLSYLSLISNPENTLCAKSLLSDSDKSNSIRVFKSTSNLSSNKSFVFSKEKIKQEVSGKNKARKTKLYKLLHN